MNLREKKMLENLKILKNEFSVAAVKAEFEAEGTRTEELLRLLEIVNKSGLDFALKIGGCEAIRDLIESKLYGCNHIIAPMIESSYGLSKYIKAIDQIYGKEKKLCKFLFNLETVSCFKNKNEIFKTANKKLDGVVFGRVDYCGSKNKSRDSINDDNITDDVITVAKIAKSKKLELVVGGGVSLNAIPALKKINQTHLSRFETRKIVFSSSALKKKNLEIGLLRAVEFELDWLKNKQEFYFDIYSEDRIRIKMLERRWKSLINLKKIRK
jgi:hypothetical protein